jgi:hypothetical protein
MVGRLLKAVDTGSLVESAKESMGGNQGDQPQGLGGTAVGALDAPVLGAPMIGTEA